MSNVFHALIRLLGFGTRATEAKGFSSRADDEDGQSTAAHALEAFLSAIRARDIQKLAVAWGDEKGSVLNKWPANDLQQRGAILLRFLSHHSSEILSEGEATANARTFKVALKNGEKTFATDFSVVRGSLGRWYVQKFDMIPLRENGYMK